MSKGRFILVTVLVFVVGGFVGWGLNYPKTFTNVSVKTTVSEPIKLFKAANQTNYRYDDSKPLQEFKGNQTFRLKKGPYVAVVEDAGHNYAQDSFDFTATTDNYSLEINPAFSSAKLSNMLDNEKIAAQQALISQYPQITDGYIFDQDTLYLQGQWYGVILKPINKSGDSYRVILEKRDGNWKVITTPPQIIISQPDYPNIPFTVVDAVDKLGS